MTKSVREPDAILVRVPDGMKARIAREAMINGRSMSSEVLALIEDKFEYDLPAQIEATNAKIANVSRKIAEAELQGQELRENLRLLRERLKDLLLREAASANP